MNPVDAENKAMRAAHAANKRRADAVRELTNEVRKLKAELAAAQAQIAAAQAQIAQLQDKADKADKFERMMHDARASARDEKAARLALEKRLARQEKALRLMAEEAVK